MTDFLLSRRHFITGLSSLIAAPAVVRYASLMPVLALSSVLDASFFLEVGDLLLYQGLPDVWVHKSYIVTHVLHNAGFEIL